MKLTRHIKRFSIIMAFLVFVSAHLQLVQAQTGDAFAVVRDTLSLKDNDLYALSACLMDADTGRVLYGKKCDEVRAMASTTKIMTLVIALEYGNPQDVVTVSQYAASMPDVQLNIRQGEQYVLSDLCYGMMLESYNDVAVAIAEHIGALYCEDEIQQDASKRSIEESKKCVAAFAGLMNDKAAELGCTNTYFITPNGLDAQDDNGKHSTTARELAMIAAYAVQNEEFNKITATRNYSFSEVNGKRNCSANNKDAFLDQMNGAFGIKTGFTGDAGYCFVGALRSDDRVFITVVLGSGWPGNRTYKWKDTRKLMEYGINNFFAKKVFTSVDEYKRVAVLDGKAESTGTRIDGELSMLLCDTDKVRVIYEFEDYVTAPVFVGDIVGKVIIYINDDRYTTFPITATEAVEQVDYKWFLKKVLDNLLIS